MNRYRPVGCTTCPNNLSIIETVDNQNTHTIVYRIFFREECRKNDLSSSRSECRSKPNPLQEWVDVFEFQITWLAKSRRPSLKTFLVFCALPFSPIQKTLGGHKWWIRSDQTWKYAQPIHKVGHKKKYFFFYHTLLGSSIHVQNLLTRLIQNVEKSLKLQFFRITS